MTPAVLRLSTSFAGSFSAARFPLRCSPLSRRMLPSPLSLPWHKLQAPLPVRPFSSQDISVTARDVRSPSIAETVSSPRIRRSLPITCPGCGALSQDGDKQEAGYYSRTRRNVRDYLAEATYNSSLSNLSAETLDRSHIDNALAVQLQGMQNSQVQVPHCDRCHDLVHHNKGVPIAHPSLADIEATIVESPHKTNHIWHVVDAADFPMSLVLDLDNRLSLAHLRPRNRRAKDTKFIGGKQADMSFIITRSDLLAPKKEFVDRMMPKLRTALRTALGAYGHHVRLGNMHVVSADRGWWTKPIKQTLLEEHGAHWLVGKVNVGKSKLFETIFPKGTNKKVGGLETNDNELTTLLESRNELTLMSSDTTDEKFSLLSPAQRPVQYPVMPVISSLPGTTVSPIRVPYRDGKSELIDLPGLGRGSMEEFILPEHRSQMIMTDRVVPEKIVIKPGQSLLLGGLIRIAPVEGSPIILAHAFTPLSTHLTSNLKAEAIHCGHIQSDAIGSIVLPAARPKMQSAGTFRLVDDVTRTYAGPLTRKDAVGLKPERLPFTIFATDILIEGIGWVELQAQVRKPRSREVERQLLPAERSQADLEMDLQDDKVTAMNFAYPEVEIFSPKGRFIGQRLSLCAFAQGGPKPSKKTARPRRSMVSVKNQRRPKTD